ncbi:zf-BED domain-containing protein [Cephalotus follicularis]|uniref:Zf-BED domain-containing protein n=1 Tax=Cephalotus follicularis TaxID=3775 RepID=A0A1Q3CKZ9_CEPFO|nr:zf-BED domain-containing protein [Cephalotus follicularis]
MGSKRKQPEGNEKSQFEKQISVDNCGEKLPTPIDTSQQHNIEPNDVDTACSSPSRDCVVVREKNPVINETKVSDVSLAPSTKKTSEMWAHFAKVEVNGKLKGECNYCKKQLVAGGKVGTTSLHDHFKSCPRRKHKDVKQNLLVGTHKSGDPLLTLGNYQFDQEVGRKKLARMIILHEYPFDKICPTPPRCHPRLQLVASPVE